MTLVFGCKLNDNRLRGAYVPPSFEEPAEEPKSIHLELSNCYSSPPESLAFSCESSGTLVYSSYKNSKNKFKINSNDIDYSLENNTCTGLTINASGKIEGVVKKQEGDSCSFTVVATAGELVHSENLSLTIDPSLAINFDQENISLEEGGVSKTLKLQLSRPAPYDTYVEYQIHGDSESDVISGINRSVKRISIVKGQSEVELNISVASGAAVGSFLNQQIRLTSGTSLALPAVSVSSYSQSLVIPYFSKISTGREHTCGITSGELYCWGSDYSSQIGNGPTDTATVFQPEKIGTSNTWQEVDASKNVHTCGINNGELYCWGSDSGNQLGNGSGSTSNIDAPQKIGSSNTWQKVSGGYEHTCGINAGELYCWGKNNDGQVGTGNTTSFHSPQKIGISSDWQEIKAGDNYTCGISNGELYCWGKDANGEVGNGSGSSSDVLSPEKIGSLTNWQKLSAGNRFMCGIESGSLYCWGSESYGKIGNGSDSSNPVHSPLLIGNLNNWQEIATGFNHTCGIETGSLYCWGTNTLNELGLGTGAASIVTTPTKVGSDSNWELISAGGFHTCGIESNKVLCWGSRALGLGVSAKTLIEAPEIVSTPSIWSEVSLGNQTTCGISNEELYCWGKGFVNLTHINSPERIGFSKSWHKISRAKSHVCAISNGELYCWGKNSSGQLGNGTTSSEIAFQPKRIGTSANWQEVSAGNYSTCGIKSGELYCWGSDVFGILGNGSIITDTKTTPQKIDSSTHWTNISMTSHACGIKNGELYCWGWDNAGKVGNGASTANVTAPEKIGTSSEWENVSVGEHHTCGINSGELYCWGQDSDGQVGNGVGSSSSVLVPEKIGSSTGWQQVVGGVHHTCGIDNGELFCWGLDQYGQQANGPGLTQKIEAPQKIGTHSDWLKISAGDTHSCGLRDSGEMSCWGSNGLGESGGSTLFYSSPMMLLDF